MQRILKKNKQPLSIIKAFQRNSEYMKSWVYRILEKEKILAKECLYIGDKYSDYIASSSNEISFMGANWGGSDFNKKINEFKIIDKLNQEFIDSLSLLFIR